MDQIEVKVRSLERTGNPLGKPTLSRARIPNDESSRQIHVGRWEVVE
jgi:hypothetical protein